MFSIKNPCQITLTGVFLFQWNLEPWLAATIFLSLSPGPGAFNTMSAGIRYGTRSTLPSIFGLQAGLTISIVLVGLGIGSLIASTLFFFTLLKIIGILHPIFLGIQK
ncbi:LysE family transporter [Desulfolithobacter sp.]